MCASLVPPPPPQYDMVWAGGVIAYGCVSVVCVVQKLETDVDLELHA